VFPILSRAGPTALFLDVDGTLLDLAPSPTQVVVPAGLIDVIASLERNLGGALALVSGRTIADLDDLFQPLRLRASGVHGAEMRLEPSALTPTVTGAGPLSSDLWVSLIEALKAFPGTLAENKRYSFTIHYRAAPTLGPLLLTKLRELVNERQTELEIIEAHFAFEIKGPNFDKGSAIEKFLECAPFAGRAPIFVGDDWTDESGFAAVERWGGTAYSVGQVRPHVNGVFSGPGAVREWLGQAAQEMAIS
jgi:trehalose 6-phosphate phosphatase